MTIEIYAHSLWEIALLTSSVGIIAGHNFWLIAKRHLAPQEGKLRVEAHTGHHFPVGESAISPERIADFRLISPNGEAPILDYRVEGAALVAEVTAQDAGARMAALTLHPRSITLEPDLFAKYIEEEDSAEAVAPDFQPGVTRSAQHEVYSKYAKAILANDDNDVACRIVGQKMEIVLERNPAKLSAGDRLPVRVLFDGAPIPGVRVSSGCDRLSDGGYASHTRADAEGRAEVKLPVSGQWFLRSHYIRRHPDTQVADWESFWPSVTFRVEDQ
ncbi:MAG TPA: DUF4198 domain-containing protein [Blastocatellia bacterium]|nr:DUF4198 domain-containing protein [Blastocatellia bacterium]